MPPLIENNETNNDPKQKANILNQHFSSKATVHGENEVPPKLCKPIVNSELSDINTSPLEVGKIIRDCKKSHQSYCGVPGKFLSMISTPISFPMSRMFNNMFEVGFFPDTFKLAHITSIWKQKSLKSSKLFYRPISLLPTMSKIMESIIHSRLLSHCIENSWISKRQGAYMKGDSTTNQLLYIVHQIRSAWQKGDVCQVAFADVEGAFEKVWHTGLLAKLEQASITNNCLSLLQSYLSNRHQITVVDGIKSDVAKVKAGIPQGSKLGPLLFILYNNDIKNELEAEVLIYADDTLLHAFGKNPTETSAILNRDLDKISLWAKTWIVTFSAEKSRDMIFSEKTFNENPPLIFNNEVVKRVTVHKHLGLMLSSSLDWSYQIQYLCLRANRKLSVLRSIKFIQRRTLDLLYKITIRSVIDYALPVYWHTLKVSEKNRLEQIQYKKWKTCFEGFT